MAETTPTAAKVAKSTVGFKNMVIAPLTTDTETGHTYGTLQYVAGAIDATITPNNTDPDIQYADDIEYDTFYADPEVSFTTTLADLPIEIQSMLFGNALDGNNVLIRSAGDKPPYFAVGFKSEKTNGDFRYVWLYKVRAKPITENYGTKQGSTVDRKTASVEWTAIKRTHDGRYQAVVDLTPTDALAATFLNSVYEYTAPGSGD